MLSYEKLMDTYKLDTNDSSSANVTQGAQSMNMAARRIYNLPYNWWFLEDTNTLATVADQQFYSLPYNCGKINTIIITSGDTNYYPEEIADRGIWEQINSGDYTSDIPQFFYIENDRVGFYPTPATSSLTITISFKEKIKDVGSSNYTTGTITLANAATAVVGAGTTFTVAMIGRWLQTTDGLWYKISAFTSTTSITIRTAYGGASVSGATFIIGDMFKLPEGFETLPLLKAVEDYWRRNNQKKRADEYKEMYDDLLKGLIISEGSKTTRVDISEARPVNNPNLYIEG